MGEAVPLVSVITVVYNNLEGLKHTFQSIITQTGKDFEWIVVDGGSTDGTAQWLQNVTMPQFRYVSEKDGGLYDAMNKGLRMATGTYVWFMNSGDSIFAENCIASLMALNERPDIIYGETMLVDAEGTPLGIRSEKTTRILPEKLTYKSMIKGMVVCHQSFIVKKSIAPNYRTEFRYSADIDWVIASLGKAGTIHNLHAILSNYLVGGYSVQNQKGGWKERWTIYVHHYGFVSTLLAHFYIGFRYIWMNILLKKNY